MSCRWMSESLRDMTTGASGWKEKSQTPGTRVRRSAVWLNVFGLVIVNPHYSFTEEGNLFSLKLGFNF